MKTRLAISNLTPLGSGSMEEGPILRPDHGSAPETTRPNNADRIIQLAQLLAAEEITVVLTPDEQSLHDELQKDPTASARQLGASLDRSISSIGISKHKLYFRLLEYLPKDRRVEVHRQLADAKHYLQTTQKERANKDAKIRIVRDIGKTLLKYNVSPTLTEYQQTLLSDVMDNPDLALHEICALRATNASYLSESLGWLIKTLRSQLPPAARID